MRSTALLGAIGATAAGLMCGCAQRQAVVPKIERAPVDARANEIANADTGTARSPRGVVLSIGRHHREDGLDVIGTHVLASDLNDAIELLPLDIRPGDVVVLLMDSEGGSHAEAMRIARIIRQRLVPTYRTFAWVENALGSALVIPAAVDHVVMAPEAHWGQYDCTLRMAPLDPSEHPAAQLDEYTRFSGFTTNDLALLRAATIACGLSASRIDGGVVLFPDPTRGDLRVTPTGNWPVYLDADLAAALELSEGTAKDLDELIDVVGLGAIEWAGQQPANEWWPLSRAERLLRDRRYHREREFQRKQEEDFAKWNAAQDATAK